MNQIIEELVLDQVYKNSLEEIRDRILAKGYNYLGSGLYRDAYLSPCGRWVLKLPTPNRDTNSANFVEYRNYKIYKNPRSDIKVAHTRLLDIDGIYVIMMEYVIPISWKEAPDWTDFVDGKQVGQNRAGEIVAYDFH